MFGLVKVINFVLATTPTIDCETSQRASASIHKEASCSDESISCNAVFYRGSTLLSAYHCIEDEKRIWASAASIDSGCHEVVLGQHSRDFDAAILYVKGPSGMTLTKPISLSKKKEEDTDLYVLTTLPSEPLQAFKKRFESSVVDDYPLQIHGRSIQGPTPRKVHFGVKERTLMSLQKAIAPAMGGVSGSPVFDANNCGSLLGVMSAVDVMGRISYTGGETYSGFFSYYVPASVFENLLEGKDLSVE